MEDDKFFSFEYPPYRVDPFIADKVKNLEQKKLAAESQKKAEPNRAKNIDAEIQNEEKSLIKQACEHYSNDCKLYESLYILHNVKDKDNFLRICFDFNNMKTVEKSELADWDRICRLDSPFLEEFLQKYGNHVFRIGTMPINKPP